MDDWINDLSIAILKQGMRDYTMALKMKNYHQRQVLEKFFMSDYGQALSYHHGSQIITYCKKIARKKNGTISKNSFGYHTK